MLYSDRFASVLKLLLQYYLHLIIIMSAYLLMENLHITLLLEYSCNLYYFHD